MGNKNFDAGHIKCSSGMQVRHPLVYGVISEQKSNPIPSFNLLIVLDAPSLSA